MARRWAEEPSGDIRAARQRTAAGGGTAVSRRGVGGRAMLLSWGQSRAGEISAVELVQRAYQRVGRPQRGAQRRRRAARRGRGARRGAALDDERPRRASRSARLPACRSSSRTPRTSPACAPRKARCCWRTRRRRRATLCASRGCAPPAPSPSARRTCRSSASRGSPTTSLYGATGTPGRRSGRPAAPAAAPPPPWPPAWCRSPRRPTAAAPSASPRPSAGSSGSSRPTASSAATRARVDRLHHGRPSRAVDGRPAAAAARCGPRRRSDGAARGPGGRGWRAGGEAGAGGRGARDAGHGASRGRRWCSRRPASWMRDRCPTPWPTSSTPRSPVWRRTSAWRSSRSRPRRYWALAPRRRLAPHRACEQAASSVARRSRPRPTVFTLVPAGVREGLGEPRRVPRGAPAPVRLRAPLDELLGGDRVLVTPTKAVEGIFADGRGTAPPSAARESSSFNTRCRT